jgi:spermidine synthase
MAPIRRVFVGLYAGSGAAALIYEVAWTRMLTLQLGHTVAAASTVLAAFMGGLACGASLAGRLTDRSDDPTGQTRRLKTYAVLELIVAAAALLLPLALAAMVPALRWAYADGNAPVRFGAVRIAISLLLLGVPAAAMGATFPVAAAWFGQRRKSAADAGVLYAANTAGAAVGAIAAGFFLIPALGLRGTTGVGVAINLMAAAGAFWLSRTSTVTAESARLRSPDASESVGEARKGSKQRKPSPRAEHTPPLPSATASPWLAYMATATCGFVALVYEVAWTRLLALVLGPTTYAFATMAAAFISGIAIGSAAGTRVVRRSPHPGVWLAAAIVFCALAAASAAWFAASRLPLIVAAEVAAPDAAFQQIVFRQALGVALLLLPTTVALGAAFPLALAVASGAGESQVGRDAARVYTANTIGAIAGALAGGFLFVPHLGLRMTFHAVAVIGAVGGGACLAAALSLDGSRRGHSMLLGGGTAAAAVAAIFLLPAWDRDLLASGAYKYAPYLGTGDLETVLRAGQLEYYKEGAAGTVSVRRLTGTLSLAIDGKVDASNAGDMLTQRLLGLLPVLLHKDAQDICVIGLGSGVTLGSALTTGSVRRAEVVEISPEVVEASAWFDQESGRSPRLASGSSSATADRICC